jgi:hypothetical protein
VNPKPTSQLEDLRAQAKYARERYQLYNAKVYGQRPTSLVRLRELRGAYEQAEARLRFATAEAQSAHSTGEGPQDHH